jgi:predicted DNA binding CopG/RHH family protein
MKRLNIKLSEEFHRAVHLEAARRGLTLQDFTKAALAVQLVKVRPERKERKVK